MLDRLKFKHVFQLRVRNYEVDWQGVLHNANHLLYFEVGRFEYLKHLKIKLDFDTMRNDTKVVLVRNEIDYKSPAKFDDLLNIYTRISYIQKTSFAFEGIIENATTTRLISENIAIHVCLHPHTNEPMPVGDEFKKILQSFEGETLELRERSNSS